MIEDTRRAAGPAARLTRPPRRRRALSLALALAAFLIPGTTAAAYLQRTVNGPGSVIPGHVYTFYVSGFTPGEVIYPTVQPVSCARTSERCVQDPCPSCSPTKVGPSGTANLRFRWPKRSFYVFANMHFADYAWQPGSRALVRIDSGLAGVPRGCQRMQSFSANPQAGSVVCAATLTRVR